MEMVVTCEILELLLIQDWLIFTKVSRSMLSMDKHTVLPFPKPRRTECPFVEHTVCRASQHLNRMLGKLQPAVHSHDPVDKGVICLNAIYIHSCPQGISHHVMQLLLIGAGSREPWRLRTDIFFKGNHQLAITTAASLFTDRAQKHLIHDTLKMSLTCSSVSHSPDVPSSSPSARMG